MSDNSANSNASAAAQQETSTVRFLYTGERINTSGKKVLELVDLNNDGSPIANDGRVLPSHGVAAFYFSSGKIKGLRPGWIVELRGSPVVREGNKHSYSIAVNQRATLIEKWRNETDVAEWQMISNISMQQAYIARNAAKQDELIKLLTPVRNMYLCAGRGAPRAAILAMIIQAITGKTELI